MIHPGVRIGRYEVGSRLGTGGVGVVYRARDVELGRELAIKVLRPEFRVQPDVVGRFLQEARAAARIDHPGIITVFECGYIGGTETGADGTAYIAMELLRGKSLAQHLAERGRLAGADALLIARQLAVALAVAHGAGIVHRDLKPDNVFLLPDPLVRGGYRTKILDFGVAKLVEPKRVDVHTHSQVMLGTPKYMSPEQGRSAASVDHRADIYTLGCMLFEMVTGEAPYAGPGTVDLIIQHTTAPVPSAAALVADLPPGLDELIVKMLAKEPADRPDSMLAIDTALAAITEAGAPTIPQPRHGEPRLSPPARPTPPPPPSASLDDPDVNEVTRPRAALGTLDASHPTRPYTPLPVRGRRTFVLVASVAAFALAAAILGVVLRQPTRASEAATVRAPADAAVGDDAVERIDAGACERLAAARRWPELATCSERLAVVDAALAARLASQARDEAINEQQLRRLVDELRKGRLEAANTLVKRIPDDSVYKAEARRRYDEATRRRAAP